MVACINGKYLQHYASGVISRVECSTDVVNHCMLLVGYDKKHKYWILKSSFGEQWGEGGYVKLEKGSNMCGILNNVLYY